MRQLATRAALFVAALLSLLSGSPAWARKVTITVTDNNFSPAQVSAQLGDTIFFNHTGNGTHPTASDNGAWNTFPLDAGHRTHNLVLTSTGNFPYHCTFHGGAGGVGMSGNITITAAPTGIRQAAAKLELGAYPNPASASRDGVVTITLGSKPAFDGKVRLQNVIGRVVREAPLRRADDEGHVTFDVADLPAGIYFYGVVVGDRVIDTKRVIIQP